MILLGIGAIVLLLMWLQLLRTILNILLFLMRYILIGFEIT